MIRAGTPPLFAALAVCASAGFGALAWLGVNVREIRASREGARASYARRRRKTSVRKIHPFISAKTARIPKSCSSMKTVRKNIRPASRLRAIK